MINVLELIRENYIRPMNYFFLGKLNYWPYVYLLIGSFLLIWLCVDMIKDMRIKNGDSRNTLKWLDDDEIKTIFSTATVGDKMQD